MDGPCKKRQKVLRKLETKKTQNQKATAGIFWTHNEEEAVGHGQSLSRTRLTAECSRSPT